MVQLGGLEPPPDPLSRGRCAEPAVQDMFGYEQSIRHRAQFLDRMGGHREGIRNGCGGGTADLPNPPLQEVVAKLTPREFERVDRYCPSVAGLTRHARVRNG